MDVNNLVNTYNVLLVAYLEKFLVVKESLLPGAGKGLFTTCFIPSGSIIVEYKGKKCLWRQVRDQDNVNPYLMRVNRIHAIDAQRSKKTFGRYANDANGISKKKGLKNNAEYCAVGNRCFIEATKNIQAGSEIFVNYGRDYWKIFSTKIIP